MVLILEIELKRKKHQIKENVNRVELSVRKVGRGEKKLYKN